MVRDEAGIMPLFWEKASVFCRPVTVAMPPAVRTGFLFACWQQRDNLGRAFLPCVFGRGKNIFANKKAVSCQGG